MSRPTVRKQIELPAGVTPTAVQARLRLVASTTGNAFGYAGVANVDVGGTRTVHADTSGLITFTNVRPNSGSSDDAVTSPANTAYELITTFPGRHTLVEYLSVPDVAGPVWAQDILVTAPASLPAPGAVTTAELTAALAALDLDDLADVNATTPTDGQVLEWDSTTSRWIPGTGAGVPLPLPLGSGGTGATTAASARTTLGLGTAAVANSTAFDAAGAAAAAVAALGSQPWGIGVGGTGASASVTARDNLGVGGPGSPMHEALTLRTFRAAWAGRRTAPVSVLALGDSNGVGYYASAEIDRWIRQLTLDLCTANSQRPDVGYVPRHSLTNYLHTWTSSGTVTEFATSGLGYAATAPAANGGYVEITETCDRFWVRYTGGTLIGAFTVTIDGGAPITVPFQAGTITGGRTWDSGPLTRGAHTVRITSSDATFAMRLEGIYFFDGNGNTSGSQGLISAADSQTGAGVRVWNGCKFGTRAGHFAASSATTWWTDNLDKVCPHLVVMAWITNEITAGTTPAQYKTDLAAVATQINTVMAAAGKPAPSYAIVVPHATGADASIIAPYRTAAYEAAATIGAAVIDRSQVTGYVGASATDVWGITTPLDGANRVHLSTLGHRLVGEHAADYILRAVGRRPAGVDDTNTLPHWQLPAATTSVPGSLSAADKAKLDGIEAGATGDQTALEIRTALLGVDGASSGLDADLLDGLQGSAYALKSVTVETVSGTTYSVVQADAGKLKETTNGSAVTVTVDQLTAGDVVEFTQIGAGQITFTAGSGVTLRAPGGAKTRVQYSSLVLRWRSATEVIVAGDTTT